jgi:hypothetical protein
LKGTRPPSLATWMLEHLTPGDRDEALAGDLLEDFRSGRSPAWYWQQTLTACTVGWLRHLSERRMLVLFAALWSMLAPAWLAVELRILDGSRASSGTWRMDAHFSGIGSIGLWLLLNLGFLWAGMLLYFGSHVNFAKAFSKEKMIRALILAAPVFFFAYFGSFVLANLYSYPGPLVTKSSITPLAELTDLRGWADLLRVPYFVTLVCALWGTTASRKGVSQAAADGPDLVPDDAFPQAHELTLYAEPEQWSATRFFGFMLAAGMLNAVIVAWIVCRLPGDYFPSLASLLARAVFCVAATTLAGVAAARFYWDRAPRPPASSAQVRFSIFALASASGWVWIPSAMLLSTQNSPATAMLAGVGAAILASGLRAAIPVPVPLPEETGMFVATLRKPQFESAGYIISAAFYLALLAFGDGQNVNAGAPLALGAYVLGWNLTRAPLASDSSYWQMRRAAARLARVAVPAVLLTVYALLLGVERRNQAAARAVAAATVANNSTAADKDAKKTPGGGGLKAWQSVVLWPLPPEKQGVIVPPQAELLAPGAKEPLIIHFVGPYWYFHAPHTGPGPHPHQASGNPLLQPVVANDFIPLVMEARQNLSASIPLTRCREIDVSLDYRSEGASISLAMLLANSAAPRDQTYLGQQPVVDEWERSIGPYTRANLPEHKTLRFAVPASGRIRSFDQITVMFLTDRQHALIGPRVAIEDFRLMPR